MDYPKNLKPIVKVAATKTAFKQKDQNKAPLTRPASSKAAFSENVLPKNKVSAAASALLQKISKLPGRVGSGSAHKKLG